MTAPLQDGCPCGLSRRTALSALGVGGLALGLAACSGQPGEAPPTGADGGGESTSGQPSAQPGEPVAATADVPVGGGVVLADQGIVLTQPEEGVFHAFTAVCTHAGCTVSEVAGGSIVCACHGSEFSAADGSPTAGPAQQPLEEFPVEVSGGNVVLT
ncbi:Rieske (2Fe-2S) protein [Allonocardiopsis opalescens]|uniref:Cytochrome bc1 complex Rieske iron-sulfur subunit n=1 Tax=Allonocardiopsis opalescens TaxID=1144618 RepID=A0A2T0PPU4_9ACTN|nr:Rieske (2Fe-2S) protein [Allonocardiopsis opalescens]PRX90921.1 secreted protein [Allonocardiopsis opalescens]